MKANCSAHSKPAYSYCKDHALVCCKDECLADHSKHNVALISKYIEAYNSLPHYSQLRSQEQALSDAKQQVCAIFNDSLNGIQEKLKDLENQCDNQILKQLVQQNQPIQPFKSEFQDMINELYIVVHGICSNIAPSDKKGHPNESVTMNSIEKKEALIVQPSPLSTQKEDAPKSFEERVKGVIVEKSLVEVTLVTRK